MLSVQNRSDALHRLTRRVDARLQILSMNRQFALFHL
jgi:hypothetical protein